MLFSIRSLRKLALGRGVILRNKSLKINCGCRPIRALQYTIATCNFFGQPTALYISANIRTTSSDPHCRRYKCATLSQLELVRRLGVLVDASHTSRHSSSAILRSIWHCIHSTPRRQYKGGIEGPPQEKCVLKCTSYVIFTIIRHNTVGQSEQYIILWWVYCTSC